MRSVVRGIADGLVTRGRAPASRRWTSSTGAGNLDGLVARWCAPATMRTAPRGRSSAAASAGDDRVVRRVVDRRGGDADEQPAVAHAVQTVVRDARGMTRSSIRTPAAVARTRSGGRAHGCSWRGARGGRRSPCRRAPSSRPLRSRLRSRGSCPSTARASRSAGTPPRPAHRAARAGAGTTAASLRDRRGTAGRSSGRAGRGRARRARPAPGRATRSLVGAELRLFVREIDLDQHARPRAELGRGRVELAQQVAGCRSNESTRRRRRPASPCSTAGDR